MAADSFNVCLAFFSADLKALCDDSIVFCSFLEAFFFSPKYLRALAYDRKNKILKHGHFVIIESWLLQKLSNPSQCPPVVVCSIH